MGLSTDVNISPTWAICRFCSDERANVKAAHPEYTVGDIAKDLGRKWGEVDEATKSKYEQMAEKDKARYERDMNAYKKKLKGGGKTNSSCLLFIYTNLFFCFHLKPKTTMMTKKRTVTNRRTMSAAPTNVCRHYPELPSSQTFFCSPPRLIFYSN